MEIKKIITKTLKQTLEIFLIIGVVSMNMDHIFKQAIWINLCTSITILIGMAGLFIVCKHFNNQQNNKANFMSMGYAAVAILLVLKFYYDEFIYFHTPNVFIISQQQFVIDLLEIVFILIALKCASRVYSIKKYMFSTLILLIGGILVTYRIDFESLLIGNEIYLTNSMKILRHILLVLTLYTLFISYEKRHKPYSINVYRLYFILILQMIYQMIYLFIYPQVSGGVFSLLGILKVIIYGNVFLFIYHDTWTIIWKNIDHDFKDKKRQLEDDNKQKNTLILVAKKLQKDVEQIEQEIIYLEKEVENTADMKQLKYVHMIQQNGYRLKKLTHNIMAINQIESGKLEPKFMLIGLVQFIEQIIESIEPYANSMEINTEFIRPKEEVYCYIDTDFIERIMLNLISNGIKYNKKNGSIMISISAKKDKVYLSIQDTGVGIKSHQLENIFDRFERGDSLIARKKEGSGLGLPIVKSLIEAHQGTISVSSKENEGTTVSIQLPKHNGRVDEAYYYEQIKKEALEDRIKVEFSDLKI